MTRALSIRVKREKKKKKSPARDSNPESLVPKTNAVSIGPTGLSKCLENNELLNTTKLLFSSHPRPPRAVGDSFGRFHRRSEDWGMYTRRVSSRSSWQLQMQSKMKAAPG